MRLTNALCREAIRLLFDHLPASLPDTEEKFGGELVEALVFVAARGQRRRVDRQRLERGRGLAVVLERRPEAAVTTLRELAGDARLLLFGHPTLEILSQKMLQFGCDDYVVTPAAAAEFRRWRSQRRLPSRGPMSPRTVPGPSSASAYACMAGARVPARARVSARASVSRETSVTFSGTTHVRR